MSKLLRKRKIDISFPLLELVYFRIVLFYTSEMNLKRPKHCTLTYTMVKVPCWTGYINTRLMSIFWKVSRTTIFGQASSVSLPNLGKKSGLQFLEKETEVWITTRYLWLFCVTAKGILYISQVSGPCGKEHEFYHRHYFLTWTVLTEALLCHRIQVFCAGTPFWLRI